jgi:putative endonuclease
MKYERAYYVYIMSNNAGITYVGVTNDLFRRVTEHKIGALPGFTRKNKTHKLVYFEEFQYIEEAILREKQIKTWRKEKKRNLIKNMNPRWKDLSEDWYIDDDSPPAS